MNSEEKKFNYTMTGYDYAGACSIVVRRHLPAYHRYAFLILLVVVFILVSSLSLAARQGYPVLGKHNWVFFAALFAASIPLLSRRRALMWGAFANAPARKGTTYLNVDDEGMTFTTDVGRSTVFWEGIVDVLPGKDGLLVLCGDMEYLPIPARAFADKAEQQAVFEDLRARLARRNDVSS